MNSETYHTLTALVSKKVTNAYSTSFSLGIKLLDKKFHEPIYNIYGFVRIADEIVDTFPEEFREDMLQEFCDDVWKGLDRNFSPHLVLHSFALTANQYNIPRELVSDFLESMRLDLCKKSYDNELFEKYIYGSAEVVGLMCLVVFCEGNLELYQQLSSSARHLGAAFQKVNFLRDLKEDYEEKGRFYFPGVDFQSFTIEQKKEIEKNIENDFELALEGIKKLPKSARKGVYIAYKYYYSLFKKIKKKEPAALQSQRIRISNMQKLIILLQEKSLGRI